MHEIVGWDGLDRKHREGRWINDFSKDLNKVLRQYGGVLKNPQFPYLMIDGFQENRVVDFGEDFSHQTSFLRIVKTGHVNFSR
ncbi:MAG: hypothetical protein AB7J40_05745 [Candidatus Altimarinota bacterium]